MNLSVLSLGEVLWDMFPSGQSLGGAPANFAYHTRALGVPSGLVSKVGNDKPGHRILDQLRTWGLPTDLLQMCDDLPTGFVTVTPVDGGSHEFTVHQPAAWDHIQPAPEALETARQAKLIYFGTLAQRHEVSRRALQQLINASSPEAWRVFDLNLRQQFYTKDLILQCLRLANVLKLNDAELAVLSGLMPIGAEPRVQVEQLAGQFDLRAVALTRGAEGSLLFQDGRWSCRPALEVPVIDTVGAGDAFAAGFATGLLWEMGLEDIHDMAAELSSHVCSCPGATPEMPACLVQKFQPSQAAAPIVPS